MAEEDEGEPRIRKVWKPSANIGLRIPTEEDLSLADKVSMLPPDKRKEALDGLDMERLQWDWSFWGRPSQLAATNSDKWLTIACSGRGFGKTRILAQAMHKKAMENPGCRMALVGRSTSDVRDILIMGESGVLSVIDPKDRPTYKPSIRRLIWPNGSEAMTFTADIPDQLRGPQFHFSFGDELGSWRVKATNGGMVNAWSQLQIATRLGSNPQIFIATTPRRVPMIVDAIRMAEEDPDRVLLIRGSTFANRHLGQVYRDAVTGLYSGTSLGKQELEGELLSDVEGALLSQDIIDGTRRDDLDSEFWKTLPRRVIGVDPSVSATPNDECGIVAFGATAENKMYRRRGYVLEDASLLGAPDVWAKEVVRLARKFRAPVVAEDNQGGAMVKMVIQAQDPQVPVTLVRSSAGKFARAEPVAHAYQQGRIHHTNWFSELEDQLTTWAPDEGMKSPDRMDALVHAATALLVQAPKDWFGKVSVMGGGNASRHLEVVRDHDPMGPPVPTNLQGNGRNRDAILRRLAPLEGLDISEFEDRNEVEEYDKETFRAIRRAGRPVSMRSRRGAVHHDPYGSPRNLRRR